MKLAAVISLLFLLSCGSKTAVPEGVIPIAKMTDVLWDVMLADGLVSYKYANDPRSRQFDTSVVLYQQVARAHGTTQQQLKQSLRFTKAVLTCCTSSLTRCKSVRSFLLPRIKATV
jgi:hypothetical protein